MGAIKDILTENQELKEALARKDKEIESLKYVIGDFMKKACPKCIDCEDVCDTCGNIYGDLIPLAKEVLDGTIIDFTDEYCDKLPLVRFAKNRDLLAEKDAEITDLKARNGDAFKALVKREKRIGLLKRRVTDLEGCLFAEQEHTENLKGLVKGVADTLEGFIPQEYYRACGKEPCDYKAVLEDIKANGGEACPCVLWMDFVAKAREVANG